MRITVFDTIYDTKTNKKLDLDTFEDFERLLFDLSKMEVVKPAKGEFDVPNAAKLISPATFKDGTTRANKNVIKWDFACVDVDDYEGSFDDVIGALGSWYYVCYSTGSSTIEKPKFRLVFPLRSPVEADDIRHFWYALNREVTGVADEQTKDLSRMFYVPGQYPNAHNFIFKREGPIMDPAALMNKHPYDVKKDSDNFLDRLPEAMQKVVIEKRRAALQRRCDTSWTSYRDCKYSSRKHVDEYKSTSETGWYAGLYSYMVASAFNAVRDGYAITNYELAELARSLDADTGSWYKDRPLEKEADRALEFVYRNM